MNLELNKELFFRNYTRVKSDGSVVTNSDFRKRFGDMSIDDAWENIEIPRLQEIDAYFYRLNAVRDFLRNEVRLGNAKLQRSNRSESEYIRWRGHEFRFSNHVYPTGSMTNDFLNIIDMTDEGAADYVINKFDIKL